MLQFFTDAVGNPGQINLTAAPYINEGLSMGILGNKGSGKSYTMAVLCEEAHRNQIPFIIFDLNGDACSLRELGDDVVVIGDDSHDEEVRRAHVDIEHGPDTLIQYIEPVLTDGFSLVIDLSPLTELEDQCIIVAAMLKKHFDLGRQYRTPVMTLVDEAHVFAPQRKSDKEQKTSLTWMSRVMSDGRKRGILFVVVSQRPAFLNKDVLGPCNVRLFGKITYEPDFRILRPYMAPGTKMEHVTRLKAGQYFLMGEKGNGRIQVKKRKTSDLGNTPIIKVGSKKDDDALAIMLAENTGRVNLNPKEEAMAYQERINHGWEPGRIAETAGVSTEVVKSRLGLLKLMPEILDLVGDGQLALSYANLITDLDGNRQRLAMKLLRSGNVSMPNFRQYVSQLTEEQEQDSLFDLTTLWADQTVSESEGPKNGKSVILDVPKNPALPAVEAVYGTPIGDIMNKYIHELMLAGFDSEAAAVGNVYQALVGIKKACKPKINLMQTMF